MIIIYNIIQFFLLFLFWPLLLLIILLTPKYRRRSFKRLGVGLNGIPGLINVKNARARKQKIIWLHALSVGEVTSALPLVSGIKSHRPELFLVFSASTAAGAGVAAELLKTKIDAFVPFPLDILPVVHRFIKKIRPDCFILVETDFWPNFLHTFSKKQIPSILVNGRISQSSMKNYNRFSFFFTPLFSSFTHLCMQTETDRNNMHALEVPAEKIHTLGNLKFDTTLYCNEGDPKDIVDFSPENSKVIVAGSTHEGEETIIFSVYKKLKQKYPDLFLILAPRNIKRSLQIKKLAEQYGLQAICRSESAEYSHGDLLILDTIGELAPCYKQALLAFVGGSLVKKGGHNPIEPAIVRTPVIFGPHMEDFSEISDDLLQCGGAIQVTNEESFYNISDTWLGDENSRLRAGQAALSCLQQQRGVLTITWN